MAVHSIEGALLCECNVLAQCTDMLNIQLFFGWQKLSGGSTGDVVTKVDAATQQLQLKNQKGNVATTVKLSRHLLFIIWFVKLALCQI